MPAGLLAEGVEYGYMPLIEAFLALFAILRCLRDDLVGVDPGHMIRLEQELDAHYYSPFERRLEKTEGRKT